MTNKEKAREISYEFANEDIRPAIRIAAEGMAAWKDQQFREYLEAKKRDRTIPVSRPWIRVLSDIIKELYHREEESI